MVIGRQLECSERGYLRQVRKCGRIVGTEDLEMIEHTRQRRVRCGAEYGGFACQVAGFGHPWVLDLGRAPWERRPANRATLEPHVGMRRARAMQCPLPLPPPGLLSSRPRQQHHQVTLADKCWVESKPRRKPTCCNSSCFRTKTS